MKNLIFFILAFVCMTPGFCQPISTTEEEYNFLTRGYEEQLKAGLDMKAGYSFGKTVKIELEKHYFEIRTFVRSESGVVAAILLISKQPLLYGTKERSNYMCVPINNAALKEEFDKDIARKWDFTTCRLFAQFAASELAELLSSK